MNTMQKIAQVHGAARHVLRQRMTKRAYDDNWVEMVKYLAETGQLSPESIEDLQKAYNKGRLMSALSTAARGGWASAKLGGGIGALVNGALGASIAGPGGALAGAALGGAGSAAASGLLGFGVNGISDLLSYSKTKEQLKSILDSLPPEAVEEALGQAPVATPDDAATVASI